MQEIADSLDRSLEVLSSGPRSAPQRQRTLRATLHWSYRLLDEQQQVLLRRLAVFAGSWTEDAVCALGELAPEGGQELVAALLHLVARSLVIADSGRYRLLEVTRQYGWELLESHGELERIRDRHLLWYAALAARADPALSGPEQKEWLDLLESDHDNLRAALAWSLAGGSLAVPGTGSRALLGLRLAAALEWFWSVRNHWAEGRRWLSQALAANPDAPAPDRAAALAGAGSLAERQLDDREARRLFQENLAICRTLGDTRRLAGALQRLGNSYFDRGENESASALLPGEPGAAPADRQSHRYRRLPEQSWADCPARRRPG